MRSKIWRLIDGARTNSHWGLENQAWNLYVFADRNAAVSMRRRLHGSWKTIEKSILCQENVQPFIGAVYMLIIKTSDTRRRWSITACVLSLWDLKKSYLVRQMQLFTLFAQCSIIINLEQLLTLQLAMVSFHCSLCSVVLQVIVILDKFA